MTLMDLHRSHLRRSLHDVHYVYVFHGLNSTHMVCREGAFDHYDSIHCVGPHHVLEIREREAQANLRPKELVEAGYPRLDRILRQARKPRAPSSKPLVLIAATWTPGNCLEACGRELIETLVRSGFEVVVRIHPETMKRSREEVESLAAELAGDPGVTFERSVGSDDSLLRAAVLVTDWSAIALEFAFGVERPVVFVDVPCKVRNERFAELGIQPIEVALRREIGVVVAPGEIEAIPDRIHDLIRDGNGWSARLARLRSEHVHAVGEAARVGARHILARAGEEA